jgi:two-component system, LytTR family, response regulator
MIGDTDSSKGKFENCDESAGPGDERGASVDSRASSDGAPPLAKLSSDDAVLADMNSSAASRSQPRLRAVIADDEPLARERLRSYLLRDTDMVIVQECIDGVEAIEAVRTHRPDLLFLDIEMPGADGFEVLQTAGIDKIGGVIFVTAFDQHALRAFEYHAIDYLLKPFTQERFEEALAHAKALLRTDSPEALRDQLAAMLGDLKSPSEYLTRLVVKSDGRIMLLRVEKIEWIEAAGNYVTLHVGGSSYLIRQTMNDIESRLDPKQFLRIHRSAIVNVESIKEMEPLFHGDFSVLLTSGKRLSLSRNYRDRIPPELGFSL